jgi:hypothetical protein
MDRGEELRRTGVEEVKGRGKDKMGGRYRNGDIIRQKKI